MTILRATYIGETSRFFLKNKRYSFIVHSGDLPMGYPMAIEIIGQDARPFFYSYIDDFFITWKHIRKVKKGGEK